jgi:hypothetical protein
MDAESLAALRQVAADVAGLPEQLRCRLHGDSLGELTADAHALALDLGYAKPQFASFSDQIRVAAGRAPVEPVESPTGDLGGGRGASARPRTRVPATMNARIRAAAGIRGMAIEHIAATMGEELGDET